MVQKFRVWDKKYKMLMRVNQINYLKGTAWLEADQGDHETRHTLTRCFDDVIFMQSTGIKDKNGAEIFEGDIVVNQYGNVGYVAYLQQEAGFVVVLKKSDYRLGHRNTGESYDVTTNHEVIGNIHSNPELLEQANEN
ncbi:YopX family protein [Enterococcus gallinarum]|uniref:YopX family protein n=1 Tax=Enterococcus gallinarum TaxID=1353 RepID=UPI001F038137|nr:YopX family protein [Enterococcus gallinarum]